MGVITGMDPHKRPATIEVIDERAGVLAAGRYGTDTAGYGEMLAAAGKFADRVWAVEGCNGIGRHLAHRLVHDGEIVSGVPPELSAQVRVFAVGNGRKTDPGRCALRRAGRRAYYDKRRAGVMPAMMAMRAHGRRLTDVVFARMLADQKRLEASPGGQSGATTDSSAAGPDPGHRPFGQATSRARRSSA